MKFSWMPGVCLALPLTLSCSTDHEAPASASGGSSDQATAGAPRTGGATPGSGFGGGGSGATNAAGASTGGAAPREEPPGGAGGEGDAYWRPKAGLSWQWQLSETVSTPLDVDVYDIDWESDRAVVENLHARGIHVICYVSVGSWEEFRPDAGDFPANVIGNDYDGWPGEKYVDLRSPVLREILSRRFDVCRDKGFDAIEPDNMDVFELGAESGFPLTQADGIDFARWLASEAHSRGLGIGQKNAARITSNIEAIYEWALTESCYSDGDWCGDVSAYAAAGKPVFMCEYEANSFGAACAAWKPRHYSPILKSLELGTELESCP